MPESAVTPHILESLRNPAAYPGRTRAVDMIQTHVSWLFLTDSHVFKIKKPVNFGFLDFSSLELRRFYCYEELRLNARLCPDIYLQVIALRETAEGAAFTGSGSVLEYAVMMKRLPADRMLDRLVETGRISAEEISTVVHAISRFHDSAATSSYISTFGSVAQIHRNWEENFNQTLQFRASTLPEPVRDTIRTFIGTFIADRHALFTGRTKNGFIRECDGDIHLGNICLVNATAYIFDCIEFNERFRFSDTAADIAFLLMDLDFHRRPDLSEAALAAYITASGDTSLPELIPFYKIYRAFVRGKVESMILLDSGIDQEVSAAAEKRAVRYFRLAQGYCLRCGLPPTLFITCGTMGSGKSTFAHQLAFELGLTLFNSDTIRKQLGGLEPETAVRLPYGEGLYSGEMTTRTYRYLVRSADAALAAGHSVLIDGGFGSKEHRAECAQLAASHHAGFVILYIRCDPEEQKRRLQERSLRGDAVSDGRVELLDRQESSFVPPDDTEGRVEAIDTIGDTEKSLDACYARIFRS